MANEEQLAILKQGVDVWNKWREESPDVEIDIREANLTQADLSGADLSTADFTAANLMKANLSKTDLSYANLREANLKTAGLEQADLSGADLRKADLHKADLTGANLKEADLRYAKLWEAHLRGANLTRADLRYADLMGAFLTRADLTQADLVRANLRGVKLFEADLSFADLSRANLLGADLVDARLTAANLRKAVLHKANLMRADLNEANLSRADLNRAELIAADLGRANLYRADLTNADLVGVLLVGTVIDKAKISGSLIYGVSVWDLQGEFEEQKDLIITVPGTSVITVDNIKVAQFVYLILNNAEIRDVINTLTSKSVLILGRFADAGRKAILEALRNKLREYNLLPIVFDFDRPIDRNITETVKTLAAISYFVIADVTSPKSSPLELQAIVPDFQIPVVPIIQEKELPFSMIADLKSQHNGLLDPLTYHSEETLIKALKAAVIDPAIEKHHELRLIKAQERKIRHAEDFIDDKGLE